MKIAEIFNRGIFKSTDANKPVRVVRRTPREGEYTDSILIKPNVKIEVYRINGKSVRARFIHRDKDHLFTARIPFEKNEDVDWELLELIGEEDNGKDDDGQIED